MRLSQVFRAGSIVEQVSKPHDEAVLLTSDTHSFMLSVDQSLKSGHFNDLIVVPIQTRAENMLLIDNDMTSGKSSALLVGMNEDNGYEQTLCVG